MESIMEAVKFALFYGIEATVIAVVGATLVAGFYQLVRDKAQSRRFATGKAAPAAGKHS